MREKNGTEWCFYFSVHGSISNRADLPVFRIFHHNNRLFRGGASIWLIVAAVNSGSIVAWIVAPMEKVVIKGSWRSKSVDFRIRFRKISNTVHFGSILSSKKLTGGFSINKQNIE